MECTAHLEVSLYEQDMIRGGGGGGGGPNPDNGTKFLRLKDLGDKISLLLHQKCFNVNSSGHKEPQNCNFVAKDIVSRGYCF